MLLQALPPHVATAVLSGGLAQQHPVPPQQVPQPSPLQHHQQQWPQASLQPQARGYNRPQQRPRGAGMAARQVVEVDVDPSVFMERRNTLPEALGKFKRTVWCGRTFYWSDDSWVWYVPTIMTVFIVLGNMAVAWPIISWGTFIAVIVLVSTGFLASFLVTCTDPGIYPRLKPGETDPLAAYEGLVFCRVCQMRRPPRTSHCYQCNVCVLEHDHHCGVLGGECGRRSLRWFTLFLICQPTACCIGVYWLVYFFVTTVYDLGRTPGAYGDRNVTSTTTPLPTYLSERVRHPMQRRLRHSSPDDPDIVTMRQIGAIFMLLIDFVIIGLIGSLAIIYVYLTVSSTTRRESRKHETSFRICLHPRKMWDNIIHAAFPPPSMLEGDDDGAYSAAVDVAIEEERETDLLV